jgi:hypothetical protein
MADITDPTVIGFVNEAVRPFSDRLVGLDASMDIEISKWFSVISPLIAGNADGDVILDGSQLDGRTPLTKADLVNFITQLLTIQTQFDGGGVYDIISKPHVNVIMP